MNDLFGQIRGFAARHTGLVAGLGLAGLALYRVSQGNAEGALESVLAALAAFGLLHRVGQVEE